MASCSHENTLPVSGFPGMRISRQQMMVVCNRMLLEDAYPSNLPMKRENRMQYYVAIKY
jgi:hypothetical protein